MYIFRYVVYLVVNKRWMLWTLRSGAYCALGRCFVSFCCGFFLLILSTAISVMNSIFIGHKVLKRAASYKNDNEKNASQSHSPSISEYHSRYGRGRREREQNSLTAKITAVIEMHFQVINKRLLLMENCNMQKVLSSLLMHFAIRRKRCGCILFFFFFFFFVATGFFYLSI